VIAVLALSIVGMVWSLFAAAFADDAPFRIHAYVILGASILSIFLNPLLFALITRREEALHVPDRPRPAPEPSARAGKKADQTGAVPIE
jgi:predicted Kef-type K+ transport protein